MRAELGPIVLNVLVAGCGLAVLVRARVLPATAGGVLAGLGLAFLCGVAIIESALVLLLVVGVPVTAITCVAVTLITITAAAIPRGQTLAVGLASARRWVTPRRPDRAALRSALPTALFAVLVAVIAAAGAVSGAHTPLNAFDSWGLWASKGILLTDNSHLPTGFFTAAVYHPLHQAYPLGVSLLESLWWRFAGHVDTRAMHIELWLLAIAFIWAAAFLLARRGTALAWGPALLLVLVAPGFSAQALSGYADLPMCAMLGTGTLCLGLWLTEPATPLLPAALTLAGAAAAKSEGLIFALIALSAAWVCARAARRRQRPLVLAAAVVVASAMPWLVWTHVNGVIEDPDVPLGNLVHTGYLAHRTDRIAHALPALTGQLADGQGWSILVPLGFAMAIACIVWRVSRPAASLYLLAGLAGFALLCLVYWASPLDIDYYISTSATRSVDALRIVAAVALAHLAAEATRAGLLSGRPASGPRSAAP